MVASIDTMNTSTNHKVHIMKALILLVAVFAITSTVLNATPALTTLDSCNTIASSTACKLER